MSLKDKDMIIKNPSAVDYLRKQIKVIEYDDVKEAILKFKKDYTGYLDTCEQNIDKDVFVSYMEEYFGDWEQ